MKTNKRLSVSLSKEDLRKIESLAEEFGESKASIVQQAVRIYYYQHQLVKLNADSCKFPWKLPDNPEWTCDD